MKLIIQKLR
ncbi:hypothetical protein VCHENC02_2287A, partial [Vibrio harveyi]